MCLAFYTVNPEPELFPKAYIVRIFKEDELMKSVCFPVGNPNHLTKAKNQACEYGRLAVREMMDKEVSK